MIFMGLLEKAGNIQANEKEPVKVEKAEKEIKAFDATVAKAVEAPQNTKKAKKAKKVKAAKKPRAAKAPRVRKERVVKVIPEGFEEIGRARSTGLWIIDNTVNWGLLIALAAVMGFADAQPTYFVILCGLISITNLILMPLWTKKTIGNWITMTQYVNSRGETPIFLYHVLKNLKIPMVLTGLFLFLVWLPVVLSEADIPNLYLSLPGFIFSSLAIFDPIVRRFHQQNFGLWEFLFGGVWIVKTLKTESSGGNKFLKRLESLSDYSESKGWLEDKEE